MSFPLVKQQYLVAKPSGPYYMDALTNSSFSYCGIFNSIHLDCVTKQEDPSSFRRQANWLTLNTQGLLRVSRKAEKDAQS